MLGRRRDRRVAPAAIGFPAVIAVAGSAVMTLITEHQTLTTVRAESLEPVRVGVPEHFDLALTVRAILGDDVRPRAILVQICLAQQLCRLKYRVITGGAVIAGVALCPPFQPLDDTHRVTRHDLFSGHVGNLRIEEVESCAGGLVLCLPLGRSFYLDFAVAEFAHSDFVFHPNTTSPNKAYWIIMSAPSASTSDGSIEPLPASIATGTPSSIAWANPRKNLSSVSSHLSLLSAS